jgi:hypothetical protein
MNLREYIYYKNSQIKYPITMDAGFFNTDYFLHIDIVRAITSFYILSDIWEEDGRVGTGKPRLNMDGQPFHFVHPCHILNIF